MSPARSPFQGITAQSPVKESVPRCGRDSGPQSSRNPLAFRTRLRKNHAVQRPFCSDSISSLAMAEQAAGPAVPRGRRHTDGSLSAATPGSVCPGKCTHAIGQRQFRPHPSSARRTQQGRSPQPLTSRSRARAAAPLPAHVGKGLPPATLSGFTAAAGTDKAGAQPWAKTTRQSRGNDRQLQKEQHLNPPARVPTIPPPPRLPTRLYLHDPL